MLITLERVIEIGEIAINRDPREYPFGYFHGDNARVFMWFASEEELISHIAECAPVMFDLDASEAKDFGREVSQIFSGKAELSTENLASLNNVAKSFLFVEWWGTFEDLVSGTSKLAKDLRLSLRDDETDSPVLESELDDFVELIQRYGY